MEVEAVTMPCMGAISATMAHLVVAIGRGLSQGRQLRVPKAVEEATTTTTTTTMENHAVEVIGPGAVEEVPTKENTS